MDIEGFDIRYTYVTDITYLRKWVSHPSVLQWFPMGTETEIENALQAWIGFCRWSCSLTATIHHVPCGVGTLFLMPYRKVAHQAMFKLVVDPEWQKRGIGEALVRNLKHLARNYFRLELLGIEIMEGNPLESILKRQQFELIYRQEKFFILDGIDKARFYMEVQL